MNPLRLQYLITPAEHLEMIKFVRTNAARRFINFFLAVFVLLLGILTYGYFNRVQGFIMSALGVFLIVLQVFVPYIVHHRVYSRNPRAFAMRTVTFDDEGAKSDSDMGHLETNWTSFDRFTETRNLFLIYQTRDIARLVPKRAFASEEDLARFRALLSSKVRRG